MSEHKKQLPPTSIDRSAFNFTHKVKMGDIKCDLKSCHSVATKMLFELNAQSGKLLLLHHKIVEIIRACPRHYSEWL